ncbi:MAG: SHOCT domain-containing protein [Actinomycetota bacterium]
MAGKGRQSWEKRQREKAKKDKQIAKRAEREERKQAAADGEDEPTEGPTEAELYARFAKLSERHAAGEIDDETFEEKRAELFEMLGLEIH